MKFEQVFLSCLGSSDNLSWKITNNINLVDQADKKVLIGIDVMLSFISKQKKEEIFRGVSTDSILILLKRERPDVYGIIADYPQGKIWVANQILNFRKRFL